MKRQLSTFMPDKVSEFLILNYWLSLIQIIFFNVGTPSGVHLFGHLLWPIFQSSILLTHYFIQFFHYTAASHTPHLCMMWVISITYFCWKILALPGIWTWDQICPGPPRFQADMLPTELSWHGFHNFLLFTVKLYLPIGRKLEVITRPEILECSKKLYNYFLCYVLKPILVV